MAEEPKKTMTPKQALDSLLHTDLNYNHVKEEAILLAVLRRDWAVRVLDAWRFRGIHRRWIMTEGIATSAPECLLGSDRGERVFRNEKADSARLAAAEAVWPDLPETVRAEIGECP